MDGDVEPILDVFIPLQAETSDAEGLAIRLMYVACQQRPAAVMIDVSKEWYVERGFFGRILDNQRRLGILDH